MLIWPSSPSSPACSFCTAMVVALACRREKEQLVRQGIQQKKSGGASVAERMGTSIKRNQKEPHLRNTVPGM